MFRVEVLNISKRNIYEVEDFKLVRLRLNFTFLSPIRGDSAQLFCHT